MKTLITSLLCTSLCLPLWAKAPNPRIDPNAQEQPENLAPYDQDLFRKNAQVFSFHAEFLYWRAQEGALDYALKMGRPSWGPDNSYAQGKFETATFNGDPGFRCALSYFRAPHYWEMWFQYTRLTSSGSNRASKPADTSQYLTGTWPQVMTQPLSGAHSHIHLNYNVGDVLVDRYWNPNPHLRLRLIGGGTVAWLNQDWHIHYDDSQGDWTHIRNRWRYIGGGLRIGVLFDWYMGLNEVYLTGGTTMALFMGSYQNRSKQTTNFAPSAADNTSIPIRNTNFRDARGVYQVQGYFGPSWQKSYTNHRLEVFAGYEINTWFNLQEIYRSTAASASSAKETWINTSALTLQGLTTRVTLDF